MVYSKEIKQSNKHTISHRRKIWIFRYPVEHFFDDDSGETYTTLEKYKMEGSYQEALEFQKLLMDEEQCEFVTFKESKKHASR